MGYDVSLRATVMALFPFTVPFTGYGGRVTGKSILLVEDNPDDEALTMRALRRHVPRCDITVARDGAEALEYLLPRDDAADGRYTLVLLDLKLPKVDGIEVLRKVRANERSRLIPIVVLTSSREERDVLASYLSGTNAYVRKPVNYSEFSEAIKTLGLFWLLLNHTVTG